MADKKISQLTGATAPLAGTEVLPIVQSGSTVKVSIDDVTKGRTVNASSFDTDVAAAGVTLSGTTLAADGTNTNIDISVTPKGSGRLITTGLGTNGAANLGNSGNNLASGGYTHRISGKSISPDGVSFLSSYGAVVFNAGSDYTGDARRYLMTNALNQKEFAIIRSVDATTDPSLGNTGSVSSGTADFIVSNDGNVKIGSGNVVISTAAKGIDFSANTGAAGETGALLNWYEEGLWTPVLTFDTPGDLAITYGAQVGTYTRIGRAVTIAFRITTTAFSYSTASGNLLVTGLPFTARTLTNMRWQAACAFNGITRANYTQLQAQLNSATSVLEFTMSGSGQSQSGISTTHVPSGGVPWLSAILTYEV
jgi:hypothetical protein